jgi:hypothetical protein
LSDRPFIALGLPTDASDQLVIKAYRWQCKTDPREAQGYFSALKQIMSDRHSGTLETEVAMESSRGKFDQEEMVAAYTALHLNPSHDITETDIIGVFNAQLADSPMYEQQLREHLRIIGVHRGSKLVQDTAMNGKLESPSPTLLPSLMIYTVIDSYESALAFLDADPNIADEHIQALFAVKV